MSRNVSDSRKRWSFKQLEKIKNCPVDRNRLVLVRCADLFFGEQTGNGPSRHHSIAQKTQETKFTFCLEKNDFWYFWSNIKNIAYARIRTGYLSIR